MGAWMREVRTYQVQTWLEEIAEMHKISKTTLAHVKNFISGVFRHAAQQGYFDSANPVKLAEIPAFAANGWETKPYSLEEIAAMLKVLPEPSATAVATAAFTDLRLGELRGLTWESYEPAQAENSLGWLNVTRLCLEILVSALLRVSLAEREGFYYRRFCYLAEMPTLP
jgi:hypothetical protein